MKTAVFWNASKFLSVARASLYNHCSEELQNRRSPYRCNRGL